MITVGNGSLTMHSTTLSVAIAGTQEKIQQPARKWNIALRGKRHVDRARSMLGEGNTHWNWDSEAKNRKQDAKKWIKYDKSWIKDEKSWIKICRRGYDFQGYRQWSSREVIKGLRRDKLRDIEVRVHRKQKHLSKCRNGPTCARDTLVIKTWKTSAKVWGSPSSTGGGSDRVKTL